MRILVCFSTLATTAESFLALPRREHLGRLDDVLVGGLAQKQRGVDGGEPCVGWSGEGNSGQGHSHSPREEGLSRGHGRGQRGHCVEADEKNERGQGDLGQHGAAEAG